MGLFVAEFAGIPLGSQCEIFGILANSATTIGTAQLENLRDVIADGTSAGCPGIRVPVAAVLAGRCALYFHRRAAASA